MQAYRGGYLPEERRALESRDPVRRAAGARDDERARARRRHLRARRRAHRRLARHPRRRCGSRPDAPGAPGPTGSSSSSPARTRSTRSWCTTPRRSSTPPSRRPSSTPPTPTCSRRTCAPPRPSCRCGPRSWTSSVPAPPTLLGELVERGTLRRRPSGWYWTHNEPASRLTDLRGSGGDPVRVVESVTGRLLGTVDAASADSTVHDGAVYVHQGATFVVDELRLEDGVALVTRRDVDYGTWARWVTTTEIQSVDAEVPWGPVTLGLRVRRRDHPGPRLPAQTHPRPAGAGQRGARPARPDAAHHGRLVDRAGRGPARPPASPSRPLPARCTPPSTRRSACSRCWRPATAGTSAGCRPRCTSTPSRPPSSCTTPTPAAPASRSAASRSAPPGLRATRDAIAACRCFAGLPRVRPVAQVRQREQPAGQGRRHPPARRRPRPRPGGLSHRQRPARPPGSGGAPSLADAAGAAPRPRRRPLIGGRTVGPARAVAVAEPAASLHHDPHGDDAGPLVRARRQTRAGCGGRPPRPRRTGHRLPGQEPCRTGERSEVRRRLRPAASRAARRPADPSRPRRPAPTATSASSRTVPEPRSSRRPPVPAVGARLPHRRDERVFTAPPERPRWPGRGAASQPGRAPTGDETSTVTHPSARETTTDASHRPAAEPWPRPRRPAPRAPPRGPRPVRRRCTGSARSPSTRP